MCFNQNQRLSSISFFAGWNGQIKRKFLELDLLQSVTEIYSLHTLLESSKFCVSRPSLSGIYICESTFVRCSFLYG